MTLRHALPTFALVLAVQPLAAWSPSFHEAQTRMALTQVPRALRVYLESHRTALMEAARGLPNDRVPMPEEVLEQFQRIVNFSQDRKGHEVLVRELGILAHMIQLMTDPSALQGASGLRSHFEAYADGQFKDVVLTREDYWAHKGVPDLSGKLQEYSRIKTERLQRLAPTFDPETRRRIGAWDRLSPAFGVLQASYSQGVHATANLWILAYRLCGESWGL